MPKWRKGTKVVLIGCNSDGNYWDMYVWKWCWKFMLKNNQSRRIDPPLFAQGSILDQVGRRGASQPCGWKSTIHRTSSDRGSINSLICRVLVEGPKTIFVWERAGGSQIWKLGPQTIRRRNVRHGISTQYRSWRHGSRSKNHDARITKNEKQTWIMKLRHKKQNSQYDLTRPWARRPANSSIFYIYIYIYTYLLFISVYIVFSFDLYIVSFICICYIFLTVFYYL